jgi:hypothetical protein
VGIDTTDIGFYDVDVFEDKIGTIKLEDWKEAFGLKPKEVADLIIDLCDSEDYTAIIIDCRGMGIAVVDELEKDREFTTPIYKAYPTRLNINEGIIFVNSYIDDKKFIVDEEVDLDLSKFKYKKILANGILTLDVNSYEKEFSNIVQLFTFVKSCVLDDKRIKNKTIIEKNLREILEILVDDLSNIDKSNTGAVNDLVRLIDKVNYIRNQY